MGSYSKTIKHKELSMNPQPIDLPSVTRLEIIDSNGRVYGKFDLNGIVLSLQDDQRTLKLFIEAKDAPI